MSTLYRLYRPQTFSDFVGQETARRILQNALKQHRTVHSYLFTGQRGTGKTSMARIFAKALNCAQFDTENGEVCNSCTNCQTISDGSFVDLIEIDAASNRGIDEIRNLREGARFAPSQKDGAKVYIIDEAHMLTKDASNALLKTLEEPPPNIYFILVTTDAEKLLPTIHSRVQKLTFYPLTHAQLKSKLERILEHEGITIEDEVLNHIVLQAEGGARNAESILGQLLSATDATHITSAEAEPILGQNTQQEAYQLLSLIARQDLSEALRFINTLYTQGVNFGTFSDTLIITTRRVLLARVNPDLILTNELLENDYQQLDSLRNLFTTDLLEQTLRELRDAKEHLPTALTAQLPLEMALTRLISFESNTSPSSHTSEQNSVSDQSSPQQSHVQHTAPKPEPEPTPPPDMTAETPTPQETYNSASESTTSPTQPEPSSTQSSPGDLTSSLGHIQKVIEEEQTSLAPLFEQCTLSEENETNVTFNASSQFQKRKLEQYTQVIEDIIERVTGLQLRVKFRIAEEPAPQKNETEETPSTSNSVSSQSTDSEKTLESADEIQETAKDIFQNEL